jgi:hypothetical protein
MPEQGLTRVEPEPEIIRVDRLGGHRPAEHNRQPVVIGNIVASPVGSPRLPAAAADVRLLSAGVSPLVQVTLPYRLPGRSLH